MWCQLNYRHPHQSHAKPKMQYSLQSMTTFQIRVIFTDAMQAILTFYYLKKDIFVSVFVIKSTV